MTRAAPYARALLAVGIAGALLLALCTHGGSAAELADCPVNDRPCLERLLASIPVRKSEFWQSVLQRPLDQRIGAAPPELIRYLAIGNALHGFPTEPRAPVVSADFLHDLRRALAQLPPAVLRLLEPKLAGIYLVEGLGSTGFTSTIFDSRERPVQGFIVLDSGILGGRVANQWASWKENTPFRSDDGTTLTVQIEHPASNGRVGAIQYILLHEIGHVVSIGTSVHPNWDAPAAGIANPSAFPFLALSWRAEGDHFAPLPDDRFVLRKRIVYYLGAQLASSEMIEAYRELEATHFATLYAATNPYDDFAESFANYVHVVLQNKPFLITIMNRTQQLEYRACWQVERCAAKRAMLDALFAATPPG